MDQIIFGVANPAYCHPGVKDMAADRELVLLLLIRHFKKHGGLILPPLADALPVQDRYLLELQAAAAAERNLPDIHYANWYVFSVFLTSRMTASDLHVGARPTRHVRFRSSAVPRIAAAGRLERIGAAVRQVVDLVVEDSVGAEGTWERMLASSRKVG